MFSAIVLGIVQGFSEFLPISSSGHLVLAHQLFGFEELDPAFNVFVQGGTVFSVLLYFRQRLPRLSLSYLKLLLVATVPAAVAGLFLSKYLDQIFSSLAGASLGFALTTIVVLLSRFLHPQDLPLSFRRSFLIGLAQAAAILPGLSRSASTITGSLALGLSPAAAFEFSFLLSIPTIAGASLLSISSLTWSSQLALSYFAGFTAAAITGYFSLTYLAKLLQRGRFYIFAPYTALLAVISLILAFN